MDPDSIAAWPQRVTQLREWAADNLVVIDGGEPTAAQLAAALKATRPAKPEQLAWAQLQRLWREDARGLRLDRDAFQTDGAPRRGRRLIAGAWRRWPRKSRRPRSPAPTWWELIDAQLPIDIDGDVRSPREVID